MSPGEASWRKKTLQQVGIYLGYDKYTMRQFLATWKNAKNQFFRFSIAFETIVAIETIVLPMNHHCLKWIVIGFIGTNGAIGHHW
jgi:hypothetical protein